MNKKNPSTTRRGINFFRVMKLFFERLKNFFSRVKHLRKTVGIFAAGLSHIGTTAAAAANEFGNFFDDFARVNARRDSFLVRLEGLCPLELC